MERQTYILKNKAGRKKRDLGRLLVFNMGCGGGFKEVLSSQVLFKQSPRNKRVSPRTSGEGAPGRGNGEGKGLGTSTPGKMEDHWEQQRGRRAVKGDEGAMSEGTRSRQAGPCRTQWELAFTE